MITSHFLHLRASLLFFIALLFVPAISFAAPEKVYRFYSQEYSSHFYTKNSSEKDSLIESDENWCYEGVAYLSDDSATSTTPLYRFYSPTYKSHFFTINPGERDALIKNDPNWNYEGAVYDVSTVSETSNAPLHRFYSPVYRAHFFTLSEQEKNAIIANDTNWVYEGIAYYALPSPSETPETPCGRPEKISAAGPDIAVGLDEYKRDDIRDTPITIEGPTVSYNMIDRDDKVIATFGANTDVEVRYDSDGNLSVSADDQVFTLDKEVLFKPQYLRDYGAGVFSVTRPESSYTSFRGSIKIRYNNTHKRIWAINILPLETYIWGIGEITATGPEEYNKLMTTAFRTYGYWKLINSTAFAVEGFTVVDTPANQIYRGYEWEKRYPRIREAAEATRGQTVTYDGKVILLPFSSWSDGKTRHYLDGHWSGSCNTSPSENVSSIFPYLIGVDDSWGKHPSLETCALAGGGNHMVGISANGALNLADDEDWGWSRILSHYITDITTTLQY